MLVHCFHPSAASEKPERIVAGALQAAKTQFADVLIIDTAGRLHVDDQLMAEIISIHAVAKPAETLFVIDAMIGQDAVVTAQAFDRALPLTGVILDQGRMVMPAEVPRCRCAR